MKKKVKEDYVRNLWKKDVKDGNSRSGYRTSVNNNHNKSKTTTMGEIDRKNDR